jgi:phosphatidate cytidylyltransferase
VQWLGLGLITIVFGTFGDLAESMVKRSMNVKDSGKLLPGHGGLLDRFDAALLAAPAVFIYLAFAI